MKKILIIIAITTLPFCKLFAPPPADNAEKLYQDLLENSLDEYYRLRYVDMLRHTVKAKESRGNYFIRGASGEIGAYQFMDKTYRNLCKMYFGEYRNPTPHNQDTLAFCKIKHLIFNRGYTIDQLAAYWNSGDPNSRKSGINKAGIPYDVGAYVEDFKRIFAQIKENWPDWKDHYNLFLYTRSGTLIKIDS